MLDTGLLRISVLFSVDPVTEGSLSLGSRPGWPCSLGRTQESRAACCQPQVPKAGAGLGMCGIPLSKSTSQPKQVKLESEAEAPLCCTALELTSSEFRRQKFLWRRRKPTSDQCLVSPGCEQIQGPRGSRQELGRPGFKSLLSASWPRSLELVSDVTCLSLSFLAG